MEQICLVIPVKQGKSESAREFMHHLEAERKGEYEVSERRIGIDKEVWYLAHVPAGDELVAYMETPDFSGALSSFSQSRDPFDMWFKASLDDVTGLDLNNPPEMTLPELLSSVRVA